MVVVESGIFNGTVVTVPENSSTGTFSSVVDECYIFDKTVVSTLIPVNSTTIGTGNVIFKAGIGEVGIITVAVGTTL